MSIYLPVALCFLAFTSYNGSRVLMSLFALELGASTAAIGVLIALYALFPLFLSLYAGKLVDRVGSYRPVLLGALGFAAGLVIPYFSPNLTALYVAAAVIGLSLVFFGVAMQNLVSSLGDAEARNKNVTLFSLGLAATGLSGPLLTGFAIDHFGHVTAFLHLSLIVFAVAAIWYALRRRVPRITHQAAAQPGKGTAGLLRQPALRRTIIVSGLIIAGVDLYVFYMPIYGHSIGLSATTIGIVLGAYAVASFLVRIVMPALIRRHGEEPVITWSLVVSAAAYVLFPFFESISVLILLSFIIGAGMGCGQPLSVIMVYNRAPAGRSGEALGLRFTMVNFMHLAIPLVFGAMSSALGLIPVFVSNAMLLFGGSWLSRKGAKT